MHVDRFLRRSNVIARSVSLSADGRSLFAAVTETDIGPRWWRGSRLRWKNGEPPPAASRPIDGEVPAIGREDTRQGIAFGHPYKRRVGLVD